MENNETQKFLEELGEPKTENILEAPLTEVTEEPKEDTEEAEFQAKNRRERRLNERLQAEREANIALTERLKVISETKELGGEEPDYLKRIKAIYGDATPEAKEATNILLESLQGLEKTAVEKAVSVLREERQKETEAVQQEEQNLDKMLEDLEDDYGADFSNEKTRKEYLDLLEKVSPKDREGNIIEFADAETTWELYNSLKEKSSSRAKDLASRSMTPGGSSESKVNDDALARFIKEQGW